MILNYFKVALRSFKKNKLNVGINIFGLTIGLASCLLIGLYIINELSYDNFNTNADRIVRTTMEYKLSNEVNSSANTGTRVGPEFKRTFPNVEEYVRTFIGAKNITYNGDVFSEDRILYADPPFFKLFSFNLIQGEASKVLDSPEKIVLTESMAKKYFGDENPIDKILTLSGREMKVAGICEDAPKNSQIKFDFVTQFLNIGNHVKEEQWWTANWITYLMLTEGADSKQMEQQINDYMHTTEIRTQTVGLEGGNYLKYHLEPLKDVHLKSDLAGHEPNGSMTYIYVFIVITILILLIAIANYNNIVIAQSSTRSVEIGMRKVMGASKKHVFFQFISESTVITLIAATLALILSILVVPYFNKVTGQAFTRLELVQLQPLVLLLLFCTVVSLLAGLYPALVVSKGHISGVLKKGFNSTNGKGTFRKSLIVGQFTISVFLIIFTLIMLQQMDFMKNTNLGYDKDHVVVLPIASGMMEDLQLMKEEFQKVNGVESVTASYDTPEFVQWSDGIYATDENGEHDISVNAMPVDLDFTKTLGMEMASGRDFNRSDFALMDTTNNRANYRLPYIINETLAERIGWTPEEAIGRIIENRALGPVVGVVKDFNFNSLHEPVGPMLMFLQPNFSRNYMIRISDTNVQGILSDLENVWNQRAVGRPFNYHFLDEDYDALYKAEQRTSLLFTVAASLAVILACLGLFGLVAYSTVQRTKEIGIRKVLGANLGSIMLLISKNFIVLVGISVLIASPLAYWVSSKWLQNFAYRIEPQFYLFVVAGVITLLITFLTLSYHSFRAAITNPVNSLKTE